MKTRHKISTYHIHEEQEILKEREKNELRKARRTYKELVGAGHIMKTIMKSDAKSLANSTSTSVPVQKKQRKVVFRACLRELLPN